MAKVQGQVFRVYPKQFPGKPMTYSVKLEDRPLYYRMGTNRYEGIVEPGKVIEFEADPTNSDGKSANVNGTVRAVVQAAPAASGTPAYSGGGGGYNSPERNNSIVYQSSRKDAVEFVGLLVKTESLKLPKEISKREEVLFAALDRYTSFFFKDVSTLGAVVREAETEGQPETAPEAPATEDAE